MTIRLFIVQACSEKSWGPPPRAFTQEPGQKLPPRTPLQQWETEINSQQFCPFATDAHELCEGWGGQGGDGWASSPCHPQAWNCACPEQDSFGELLKAFTSSVL